MKTVKIDVDGEQHTIVHHDDGQIQIDYATFAPSVYAVEYALRVIGFSPLEAMLVSSGNVLYKQEVKVVQSPAIHWPSGETTLGSKPPGC